MSSNDRPFLTADIPSLLKKLKWEEKAALLAAPDWWNTQPIPRLQIPSVRLSDGPNGVRGSSHLNSTPAQCLPVRHSLSTQLLLFTLSRLCEYSVRPAWHLLSTLSSSTRSANSLPTKQKSNLLLCFSLLLATFNVPLLAVAHSSPSQKTHSCQVCLPFS